MAKLRVANRMDEAGRPLTLELSSAISILNNLLREGVRVMHECGGKARCGTCRFRTVSGGSGLSPVGEREATRLSAMGVQGEGIRLACQTRAARDVEIELVN